MLNFYNGKGIYFLHQNFFLLWQNIFQYFLGVSDLFVDALVKATLISVTAGNPQISATHSSESLFLICIKLIPGGGLRLMEAPPGAEEERERARTMGQARVFMSPLCGWHTAL